MLIPSFYLIKYENSHQSYCNFHSIDEFKLKCLAIASVIGYHRRETYHSSRLLVAQSSQPFLSPWLKLIESMYVSLSFFLCRCLVQVFWRRVAPSLYVSLSWQVLIMLFVIIRPAQWSYNSLRALAPHLFKFLFNSFLHFSRQVSLEVIKQVSLAPFSVRFAFWVLPICAVRISEGLFVSLRSLYSNGLNSLNFLL